MYSFCGTNIVIFFHYAKRILHFFNSLIFHSYFSPHALLMFSVGSVST